MVKSSIEKLNRIAEIAKEFARLGVQMGMPTGYNYFSKKKDWLDGVQVIYTSPSYKVSVKSTFEDNATFVYKEIDIRLNNERIALPLCITDEQIEAIINELETKLEYLKSTEGLLELKEVVNEVWNSKRW